jgi:hypothetical protein
LLRLYMIYLYPVFAGESMDGESLVEKEQGKTRTQKRERERDRQKTGILFR